MISCGWVDSKTGEHVPDHQIKARYEKVILAHTGIRLIEPELFDGYDPKNKTFLQQVALNQDMEPMEVSAEEALHFKRKHQQNVDVWHTDDGLHFVRLKKGAVLYIPKALNFNRFVAGQVPTSWDPAVLGVPHDIIQQVRIHSSAFSNTQKPHINLSTSQQVDRVTLFTLVSTVEALVSAGITDPYEFYKYVHVSEVGNTIGGGFGGTAPLPRSAKHTTHTSLNFRNAKCPQDSLGHIVRKACSRRCPTRTVYQHRCCLGQHAVVVILWTYQDPSRSMCHSRRISRSRC